MRQKSKNPSAKSQPRSSESEFVSANYANYANFRELVSFMFCLIRGNPRNSRIIFISFLGMPEEALAIFQQIPNDHDVDREYDDHHYRMRIAITFRWRAMDQLEDFDGNEEHRFENGHPTDPFYTEHQSDSFNQRKKAID